MIIQPLQDYKGAERFLKISKNDTHYRYVGRKYDVDMLYHSSNFYSPDFFNITVTDKSGNQVWDGNHFLIHGDFFSLPFLSETYDAMVLPVVHDTSDSHSMQVMHVDLKTGNCKPVTDKGFYPFCGHFLSFNGIFWGEKSGIRCVDFDRNKAFYLSEVLSTNASDMLTWSPCMVRNSVIVVTKESAHNVLLVDMEKGVVNSAESIIFKPADKVAVTCQPFWNDNRVILTVNYLRRSSSGAFQLQGSDYYKVVL